MKSINIRKVAAVAAGTAMLVGAAFAGVTGLTKDFIIDENGNPNVQIVVGSNAAASDGVAAANLAATIGSMAYVSTGGESTVTPTSSGTATISVAGGQVTLPEASVRSDQVWGAALSGTGLTLSSAQGLAKGTFTYRATEYDYEEEILAKTLAIGYNEGNDYHGVSFSAVKPNRLYYRFRFVDNFPFPGGALASTVTIPFLGENYVLNKFKLTEAELVKGEEKTLGIGQSADIIFGDTTYTVKLDDARLNEVTTTGQVTVTVTVDGSSTTISLDTANDQSKTIGGFQVFVQSVAKSYTPGQGGSATLRLGGDVLTLKDGLSPTQYPDWKANFVTGTNSSEMARIELIYDKTVQAKDQVTQINGPEGYFSLQFVGDQVARGTWEDDTITVAATGSTDLALDEITYKDFTYEKTYTVPLNDDLHQTAYLAVNETGGMHVHNGTMGNVSMNAPATAGTALTTIADWNITSFMTLFEDDVFFVNNVPVKIDSISSTTTTATAKVLFTTYYGSDSTSTQEVKASSCTNSRGILMNSTTAYGSAGSFAVCTGQSFGIGGASVTFGFPWNKSFYDGTNFLVIRSGADHIIRTKYGWIQWVNGTGMYRHTQVGAKANLSGPGPQTVNITDSGNNNFSVGYNNVSTNPGIYVAGGTLGANLTQQSTTNPGYDNQKYAYTDNAWIEMTDTGTAVLSIPENDPRTMRVALIRGAAATSTASDKTVTTSDTLPYEVSTGVTVNEFTCSADDITYSTGVSFGSVGTVVIDDNSVPSGNAIVIGGHLVNMLAVGVTDSSLTAAGDKVEEMVGTNVYVAGYTAADTNAAVNDLIAQVKAL